MIPLVLSPKAQELERLEREAERARLMKLVDEIRANAKKKPFTATRLHFPGTPSEARPKVAVARNASSLYSHDGLNLTLYEWAKRYKTSRNTLVKRLRIHGSISAALQSLSDNKPRRGHKPGERHNGKTIREWAKFFDISIGALYKRSSVTGSVEAAIRYYSERDTGGCLASSSEDLGDRPGAVVQYRPEMAFSENRSE